MRGTQHLDGRGAAGRFRRSAGISRPPGPNQRSDARAARFFTDTVLVHAELAGWTRAGTGMEVVFLAADHARPLDVPDESMELVISLFTGSMWEHARRYLRRGGWLLANTSHGYASLAALDPSLRLTAVVHHRGGRYRLVADRLEEYLIPKRPQAADAGRTRSSGRGIAYNRTAVAYLFQTP